MHRSAAGTCGGLHGGRVCTGGLSLHLVRDRPPQPRRPGFSVRSVATTVRTEAPAARAPTECWEGACAGGRGARPPASAPPTPWPARGGAGALCACAPQPSLPIIGSWQQGGGAFRVAEEGRFHGNLHT